MDYVGGDEGMSEIEIDKLSLPELRGHLADHMEVNEQMKLYFLLPGKELSDGLIFMNHSDNRVRLMAEHITDGGVADVFVESTGANEEDYPSRSDYVEEIGSEESDEDTDEEDGLPNNGVIAAGDDDDGQVFITDDNGVITQVSPKKAPSQVLPAVDGQGMASQVTQPSSSQVVNAAAPTKLIVQKKLDNLSISEGPEAAQDSANDSESEGSDYVAYSDDSGEESEVVELRRHA